MKPIKTMTAVLFCTFSLVGSMRLGAQATNDTFVKSIYNFLQGKSYNLAVRESDLENTPRWHDDKDNPPFAARAAERAARIYVKRVIPESDLWSINRIILEQAGKSGGRWIYIVEFTPYEKGKVLLGGVKPFQVPVLMNGFIPEAMITNQPGR